jgi:hypothetical protein
MLRSVCGAKVDDITGSCKNLQNRSFVINTLYQMMG